MKIVFLALILVSSVAFAEDEDRGATDLAARAAEKFDPLATTKAEQLGEKNGFTIVKMSGTYKDRTFGDRPFATCFAQKGGRIYKIDLPDDMKCADDLSPLKNNINSVNVESQHPLKVEKQAVTDGRILTYHRGDKKSADGKPIGPIFSGSTILEQRANDYIGPDGKATTYTAMHLWIRSAKGDGRFEVAADNVTVEKPLGNQDVLVDHSAGLKEDMRTVVVQGQAPKPTIPEEKKIAIQNPPDAENLGVGGRKGITFQQEVTPPPPPVNECAPLNKKLTEKNWANYCAALNKGTCGKNIFKNACKETCSAKQCDSDYDLMTSKAVAPQNQKVLNNTCDNANNGTVQNLFDDLIQKRDVFSQAADNFKEVVAKQGSVGKCINILKSDTKYDIMDKFSLASKLSEQETFCSQHAAGNSQQQRPKKAGEKTSEADQDPNRGVASDPEKN